MMIFKNKNFVKRDPECTTVVFCQADAPPNDNYLERVTLSEFLLYHCDQLYTQNGCTYYGYL